MCEPPRGEIFLNVGKRRNVNRVQRGSNMSIQQQITNSVQPGGIVEAAAGLAPNSVGATFSAPRPRRRKRWTARPPASMPHRPASPHSWRFPPPLT